MDPAMTAKLLQLVNSAFFGIARKISNPVEAVQLLGINTVRSLALSIHAFSCFDHAKMPELSIDRIWTHCLVVGNLARKIAQIEELELGTVDEAFISGLLHDLGKLMLAVNMPERYVASLALARKNNIPDLDAEREIFGATHADVGAYLLGLWGLPVPIVEAVALHHLPRQNVEKTFTPLTAVHVANVIDQERSVVDGERRSQFDLEYLADLGLEARLPEWRLAYEKMAHDA
jgi:putative nucleotidyltransferase with HDIG domain